MSTAALTAMLLSACTAEVKSETETPILNIGSVCKEFPSAVFPEDLLQSFEPYGFDSVNTLATSQHDEAISALLSGEVIVSVFPFVEAASAIVQNGEDLTILGIVPTDVGGIDGFSCEIERVVEVEAEDSADEKKSEVTSDSSIIGAENPFVFVTSKVRTFELSATLTAFLEGERNFLDSNLGFVDEEAELPEEKHPAPFTFDELTDRANAVDIPAVEGMLGFDEILAKTF